MDALPPANASRTSLVASASTIERAIASGGSSSRSNFSSAATLGFGRSAGTRGVGDDRTSVRHSLKPTRTFASSSEGGENGEGGEGETATSESEVASGTEKSAEEEDIGWTFGVKNQRRPTRRDKGSYDAFLTEIDSYPTRHDVRDVYNAREWVEASLEESCAQVEVLVDKMLAGMKEMEALEEKYADIFPEQGNADDGSEQDAVLTWKSEFVMEPGDEQEHPLNWKVSVEVKLSELQCVTGLSDEAIEYIKLLVDKRYNAKQDTLRIVCRRNNNREHNRQWCLKVLYDLIQEGNREYPSDSYSFTPDLGSSSATTSNA